LLRERFVGALLPHPPFSVFTAQTIYSIKMSSELVWQITKKHNALIVSNRSLTSFDKDPLNLTNVPSKKASGLANPKAVGVAAGKNGAVLLVKNRRAATSKPSRLTTAVRHHAQIFPPTQPIIILAFFLCMK
jgi:hypothetical protein